MNKIVFISITYTWTKRRQQQNAEQYEVCEGSPVGVHVMDGVGI